MSATNRELFLEEVKKALRINHGEFDNEVELLIDSCKQELRLSGIMIPNNFYDDPMLKHAIIVYCKSNFGFDNSEAERLNRSYESIKSFLTTNEQYKGE